MIAALVLTAVCQGYPGCSMPGYPLVGVVVKPNESPCVAFRLPAATIEPCIELGDLVPLGRLYAFPALLVGHVVALAFEEPPP